MRWIIKFNGEEIGSVLTNHSMTDEEICEMAGVELAITQEDFERMPENEKYDLEELEIVSERERQIEILMLDGCTRSDAKKHLDKGSVIYSDFEENFDEYMSEWDIPEEDIPAYRAMIDNKIPALDWGIVEDAGKTYYIMYVL